MQNFGLDALSTDWWTDSPENTINSPDFHWGMENLALTANTFILQYVGFSLIIFSLPFQLVLNLFFSPLLGLTPLKFCVSASLSCGVFCFVLFFSGEEICIPQPLRFEALQCRCHSRWWRQPCVSDGVAPGHRHGARGGPAGPSWAGAQGGLQKIYWKQRTSMNYLKVFICSLFCCVVLIQLFCPLWMTSDFVQVSQAWQRGKSSHWICRNQPQVEELREWAQPCGCQLPPCSHSTSTVSCQRPCHSSRTSSLLVKILRS